MVKERHIVFEADPLNIESELEDLGISPASGSTLIDLTTDKDISSHERCTPDGVSGSVSGSSEESQTTTSKRVRLPLPMATFHEVPYPTSRYQFDALSSDSKNDGKTSSAMSGFGSPSVHERALQVAKRNAVRAIGPSVLPAQHETVSHLLLPYGASIVRYHTSVRRTTASVRQGLNEVENMHIPASKYLLHLQKDDQFDSADDTDASALVRTSFSSHSITMDQINTCWGPSIEARSFSTRAPVGFVPTSSALSSNPEAKLGFKRREEWKLARNTASRQATIDAVGFDGFRCVVDNDDPTRNSCEKRSVRMTSKDDTQVVTNEGYTASQTFYQPSQGYCGKTQFHQSLSVDQEHIFTGHPKVKSVDLLDSSDSSNTYSEDPASPQPKSSGLFHNFMELPGELRELIYSFTLVRGKIQPHLCTMGTTVKFCDHNDDRIDESLAITRVSRKIREESLPVFYKDNTFAFGVDLPAYIEYLNYLGRLQWIHHVEIPIQFYNDENGARAMRDIQYYIREHEKYEKKYAPFPPASNFFQRRVLKQTFTPNNLDLTMLKKHPVFESGGLPWIGVFFVLRRLSTAHTSPTNSADFERKIVLRVPDAAIFDEYKLLQWFPKVAVSLGIELKFVSGADLNFTGRGFVVEWMQSLQKLDATVNEPVKSQDHQKMVRRAFKQFPAIQDLEGSDHVSYYRVNCETGELEWTRVNRCHTLV